MIPNRSIELATAYRADDRRAADARRRAKLPTASVKATSAASVATAGVRHRGPRVADPPSGLNRDDRSCPAAREIA